MDLDDFTRYVALGDSMSIDLYPAYDIAGADELNFGMAGLRRGLGAASLFFQNDDEIWPEFRHRDLRSLNRRILFRFEANARGASELRSVWLEAIGA
jgi:hypothetical protein